jgi:deoxyribodipyrimidine photo-lyase
LVSLIEWHDDLYGSSRIDMAPVAKMTATGVIEPQRIRFRRNAEPGDGIVVYWMQQAQRAEDNPALEYAIQQANALDTTLVVVFCVVAEYPEASARHFTFMFQGLAEVEASLRRRGIRFEAVVGAAAQVLGALDHRISLLVCDRGYLPIQERWRRDVDDAVSCPIHEIETDAVVPVDLVSDKPETAARTIRPKIHAHLDRFVVKLDTTALSLSSVTDGDRPVNVSRSGPGLEHVDLSDVAAAVESLGINPQPSPVNWKGGTSQAKTRLRRFISDVLPNYADLRNRYDREHSCSTLSPHLHFGQISPVEVVRVVRSADAPAEHIEAFVEEVVVRRELAFNFVQRTEDFDRFAGLPEWARETLTAHTDDDRPGVVTAHDLEAGRTDDEIWNTIMGVIKGDGWVHNQLRMYWGKQILHWTNTPEHAFRTLLELNNRWFLDGRDPNSYANVAWCFGRHDQGFKEREVLGKVRPFTDKALRRKGDLDAWLEQNRMS